MNKMIGVACPDAVCPGVLKADIFGEPVCSDCGLYVADASHFSRLVSELETSESSFKDLRRNL